MTVEKEAILRKHVSTITFGKLIGTPMAQVFEAMDEYAASLLKENEELREIKDNVVIQRNEYMNAFDDLQLKYGQLQLSNEAKEKECEYWKQRCEAAEILVNSMSSHFKNDKYSYKYWNDWQALKNKTQ